LLIKKNKTFWIIIFIAGCLVRSTHLLQPINTNSWREADVSAIARNFYVNGTDIFHPQIGYGGNGPGYVESEFQLYTYLIATCHKIFGYWEQTGRIVSFVFSILTMLVFFKLSNYLFVGKEALLSSAFFALSPLLMVISVSVQPEAFMFFFYTAGAYTFIKWLDGESGKFYWLTILCISIAILCKVTAANIGIFFLALIIIKKGWRFLLKPKVFIMGLLITLPSILWYSYCHKFYVLYGNSLGISNEYHWMGWDFFTNHYFIAGLIKNELSNVWTVAGALIVLLAIAFTDLRKDKIFLFAILWYAAACFFYIITCRTTAQQWAWYYHIFSVPAVSVLMALSAFKLFTRYIPSISSLLKNSPNNVHELLFKKNIIIFALLLLILFNLLSDFRYLTRTKSEVFQVSKFYSCRIPLEACIPKDSLILTTGGRGLSDEGHLFAFDIGYFYYWLDKKGYSISIEKLSLKNIKSYKTEGVRYFVAEEQKLKLVPHLEEELKNKLKVLFECNGCILFKI